MKPESRTSARWWLAVLLLVAFGLRVGVAIASPSSDYPDEIFQTREPAHRLAYGYGVVTWEFRDGIRNWVLPAFLAGVMRATAWMGPGSTGYSLGILLVLSAISLGVVATAFWWGWRVGGLQAAIIPGAACALWYELIYYAPQALTEVIAAHLLVPGLYFACFPYKQNSAPDSAAGSGEARPAKPFWRWLFTGSPDTGNSSTASVELSRTRLLLAGLLCGTALMLRVQLLPAIVVVFLLTARERRRWTTMLAGLALPVFIFGVVDWATWGAPFASYWRTFAFHVLQHRGAYYGVQPVGWLFTQAAYHFGPIAVVMLWGWRRALAPTWVALAVLLAHTAFEHKEYRYLYPALPLLCIVLGLGTAALFSALRRAGRAASPALTAGAVLFLASASGIWGLSHGTWDRLGGYIQSFRELSLRNDICGLAIDTYWSQAGYSTLHHDVPMYVLKSYAAKSYAPHDPASFNYAAAPELDRMAYPGYAVQGCWSGFCVYRRDGGCTAPPNYSFNGALARHDELLAGSAESAPGRR